MAVRIESQHFEAQRPPSTTDLRHVFESAVSEIHRAEVDSRKPVRYGAPIVSRAKVLGISQADAEKRALSDAARALSRLWRL